MTDSPDTPIAEEEAPAPLALGDEGRAVRELQRVLKAHVSRIGYRLVVSGVFTTDTEDTLRRFQEFAGIDATGVADPDTVLALGLL